MRGRGSLEFNPLRLHVVREWLRDRGLTRTSQLRLASGRNANAAVHDDHKCRPTFDPQSRRWLQRCISCAHLGTNTENARLSLELQRRRVARMRAIIRDQFARGYLGSGGSAVDAELVQHACAT